MSGGGLAGLLYTFSSMISMVCQTGTFVNRFSTLSETKHFGFLMVFVIWMNSKEDSIMYFFGMYGVIMEFIIYAVE